MAVSAKFLETYQDRWDRRSTIRSRPRRDPAGDAGRGDFYPIVRQPIAIHPEVAELGRDTIARILVQSSYKYMNDVALTETEVVNRTAIRIANGRLAFDFPDIVRQIALTVVVDEAYHALVAREFIRHVEQRTGIAPISLPNETELSRAITATKSVLTPALHDDFDVIAICIAENTLTQEIVDLSAETNLATPFVEALSDHLADEAQHAAFFQGVLDLYWNGIPESHRRELGSALPAFIRAYLNVTLQRGFDTDVLTALGVPAGRVTRIVGDTHDDFDLGPQHPMLANILTLLDKAKVFTHAPTRDVFVAQSWIA
jgi:hypothetical protein